MCASKWGFRLLFANALWPLGWGAAEFGLGQEPKIVPWAIEASSDDQGLRRWQKIEEATNATVAKDGSNNYQRAAAIFDEELSVQKSGWVLDWLTRDFSNWFIQSAVASSAH
jgi:hypothetical protein